MATDKINNHPDEYSYMLYEIDKYIFINNNLVLICMTFQRLNFELHYKNLLY